MEDIKFPVEVSGIKTHPLYHKPDGLFGEKCGTLVSVRPCDEKYGEKYGKKTFLGILLGDLPIEVYAAYNTQTKEINISAVRAWCLDND